MRILHVNKFLYRRGGAEAYMLDLADLQRRAGHDVEFFAMQHPDNIPATYDRHFAPHIQLEPHPPGRAAQARAAGRIIWSPSSRRGVDAVLHRFRPDVVHLHNIYHQLSPSILRPMAGRHIPAVMTLHDYKLACPTYQFLDHGKICEACLGGRYFNAARRRCKDDSLAASLVTSVEMTLHMRLGAYEPVQRFIAPSRFATEKMLAAGISPDRLRWLRHFVDAAAYDVKTTGGGPIVYAGRLAPEKAVDVLIEAVGCAGDELRLVVAGDGPSKGELEALAARVAPGQVQFTGRLEKDELHDVIRSSVALAMPSRWYEDAPMIVLEAFACGVPLIGTMLGGVPELIVDGEDGLLVPPNDVRALATALVAMAGDVDRAGAMGSAGRAKVERLWSPVAHLDGLEAVYDEARTTLLAHPA
jgi:glycosyltransferase involved in cell wall biosynthesis